MKTILLEKFASQTISLAKDEKRTYVFALNETLPEKVKLNFELCGEGAELDVIGFVNGKGQTSFPIDMIVHHVSPRTRGYVHVRSIMRDQSNEDFSGMARIEKDATQSDTYLAMHTLLLSKKAKARAIPALEIETDDVKAGHSASTGQLDEEAIFYLVSRGIPEEKAKKMLTEGFFEELLIKIPDEQIREQICRTL